MGLEHQDEGGEGLGKFRFHLCIHWKRPARQYQEGHTRSSVGTIDDQTLPRSQGCLRHGVGDQDDAYQACLERRQIGSRYDGQRKAQAPTKQGNDESIAAKAKIRSAKTEALNELMLALYAPPRQVPHCKAANRHEPKNEKSQQPNPACQQQTMPAFSAKNGGVA